ncbi:hypothetical protein M5K25_000039 [Dendrobium thyrsiflorum]|uniref:Uncharacterized protein n=1 Tax=Dendrobium thyrsiflorum TaxID=117978 RepID=A0ABD0VSU4_DENTH
MAKMEKSGLLANSSIPSGYLRTQVFPIKLVSEQVLGPGDGCFQEIPAAVFLFRRREFADFEFLNSILKIPQNPGAMAAKKVDALEERLEGEMNQIKTTVDERMSSMEGQVADLRDMIKKMLEVHNQTTTSIARSGEGRSTNSEIRREEEAEIILV